ncbi:MAG: hypothetical protein VX776_07025 [Planctomycetota bacterium]|nr:hypothetical protein [Planctomycetota bacterium]
MSDQQEQQTRGILGDVQSVKRNGAASLTELREFIGSLKGRKPQDVMGDVASNGLVQGMIMSTAGFIVVLLVFTAIPFFMAEKEPVAQKEVPPTAVVPENQATQQESVEQNSVEEESAEESAPTGDDVLDNLGIGETKEAKPDENPLDDKFNDLLDGVK